MLAPLTGLPASSAANLGRPALAVKIDNHTDARPHLGLDKADIVYEEPVEGGITRFIAIFHSRDASKIGPIRSARLTDLDVLAEYGRPLLSFSGAAQYVLRAIRKANLVSLPHGAYGSIYRRDNSRWFAPHNLFSSTVSLWRVARNRNTSPAPQKWAFGPLIAPPPAPVPSVSPGATPTPATSAWPKGRRVTVPFGGAYDADWRYDGGFGRYFRFNGSVAHRLVNGTQISAQNVLIVRVGLQKRNQAAAEHGTPELALVGSGEAVLLRDGVRIVGRWSRARLGAPTRFTDSLGRAFVFKPGITWVELVPTKLKPRYK